MENVLQFAESVLAIAHDSCTHCLIDELGDENSEIGDIIARFRATYFMRDTSPESVAEYNDSLAEFLARVITMALFTAELMHRPGVRWIDESTEIALPVMVSPN